MIRGKRVLLRTMREKDLDDYLRLTSEIANRGPHFPLFLHSEVSLRNRYNENGFWSDGSGTLLVFDAEETRILGQVNFFKTVAYWHGYELGYILFGPEDRGKGYITEAVRLVSKYLFDAKPILRLTIQCEPGNAGSRKVAEKCGYKLEGIARSVFESYGQVTDIEVWSLTKADIYSDASYAGD